MSKSNNRCSLSWHYEHPHGAYIRWKCSRLSCSSSPDGALCRSTVWRLCTTQLSQLLRRLKLTQGLQHRVSIRTLLACLETLLMLVPGLVVRLLRQAIWNRPLQRRWQLVRLSRGRSQGRPAHPAEQHQGWVPRVCRTLQLGIYWYSRLSSWENQPWNTNPCHIRNWRWAMPQRYTVAIPSKSTIFRDGSLDPRRPQHGIWCKWQWLHE